MKTFRLGLRTKILLSLTLLLVTAMLLTSFVIASITERDLLHYKAADGKAVVRRIQLAVEAASREQNPPSIELIKERLKYVSTLIAPSGLFEEITIVGKDGTLWAGHKSSDSSAGYEGNEVASVLRTQEHTIRINRDQGLLTVTAPLFVSGRCVAAVRVPVRIDRSVEGLKRSQQLIWFYIGLNVFVLLVFGNFLLSRIIIRPVERLARKADKFEDSEGASLGTHTDCNEVARLTMSLNRMLKRLAENREQMEAQIRSLEQANLELKEARDEVLHSEKLASLGRLAAGVAHEVGNPIGSVLGYTNLLMGHVEKDTEAKDYLTRIEKEITRIDTIIRDLLDFSRPSPDEPTPVAVNTVVSEAASFFAHQKLTASVNLEVHLGENLGMVRANPDQLKQVLINLLFNAYDALDNGGSLSIVTRRTPPPQKAKGGLYGQEAENIEISVSDTGTGIPATALNMIFDPFYTTKPPGEGTGLGLAVSLRIVESFGGTISVDSAEGKGSTFTVTLRPWNPNDAN